jgi:integrase
VNSFRNKTSPVPHLCRRDSNRLNELQYPIVVVALFCGLRRGEVLTLRWQTVDLDAGRLTVAESLEQLQDGSLRFKQPKTKAGRRTVSLPAMVIEALRQHRAGQLRQRLALGQGRAPEDSLLFPTLDGSPRSPRAARNGQGLRQMPGYPSASTGCATAAPPC